MSEIRFTITATDEASARIDSIIARIKVLEAEVRAATTGMGSIPGSAGAFALPPAVVAQLRAEREAELGTLRKELDETIRSVPASDAAARAYNEQSRALENLQKNLISVTGAQGRLIAAEQAAARAIAERAAQQGIPAAQLAYQLTGRDEFVTQERDARGRFLPGQGQGRFAAAVVGAEADVAKEAAMVKIRQEDAQAIAQENRLLAEKLALLRAEASYSAETAAMRQTLNRNLVNDSAQVFANEKRIRAERLAEFEEEKKFATETKRLKDEVNKKLVDEAAVVHATEARTKAQRSIELEEEKAFATETVRLRKEAYQKIADDAARTAAAEAMARSKSAIGQEAFRQMPLMDRMRMFRADDAQREAAGLNYYAGAASKVRAEIEAMAAAHQRAESFVRNHSMAHGGLTSSVNTTAYAFRKLVTEFDELMRGQRGQMISTFGSMIRDMGTRALPVLAPLAAVFATIKLGELNYQMAELAEKTYNAAAAAGMGVEQYSRLQRTLQAVGGDANHLVTAFATISQSVERALVNPVSRESSAFSQILGSSTQQDLTDMLRDTGQGLETLRRRFQEMGPTLERTELFRAALGRGFQNLIPILNMTDVEFAKFTEEARKSGAVLDETQNKTLRNIAEAWHKLGLDVAGLGNQLALLSGSTRFVEFLDTGVNMLKRDIQDLNHALEIFRNLWNGIDRSAPRATARITQQEDLEAQRGRVLGSTLTPEMQKRPALFSPIFDASAAERELTDQVRRLHQETELEKARYETKRKTADRNAESINEIDKQEEGYLTRQAARERQIREQYATRAERVHDQPAADRFREGVQLDTEAERLRAQAIGREHEFNRRAYEDFAAAEREKIQEARGNWVQIQTIYQEWLTRAKTQFGEAGKEFLKVQREMVRAAQEANDKLIADQMRVADTKAHVVQTQIRLNELGREAEAAQGSIGRTPRIASMAQEITELRAAAAEEIALYQEIANQAQATTEQKIAALDRAARVAEDTAGREVSIAKRMADEIKREVEEASKSFVQLFDKAGSALENFIEAGVMRTKTQTEAVRELFLSVSKDILHTTLSLGSQLAAQGLSKALGVELQPGKGLGDLLGQSLGKLFGLGTKESEQMAMRGALLTGNQQRLQGNAILQQIRELLSEQKAKVGEAQKIAEEGVTRDKLEIPGYRPPGGTVSTFDPTLEEKNILAQVRKRESSEFGEAAYRKMHFAIPGQPDPTSISEIEGTRVTRGSHAFGAYGFQPGTYREMASITGRYGLDPASQDINALQLLRAYGPNASQSWQASAPSGGYRTTQDVNIAIIGGSAPTSTAISGALPVAPVSAALPATPAASVTPEIFAPVTIGGGALATASPVSEPTYGSLDYFLNKDWPRIKEAVGYHSGGVVGLPSAQAGLAPDEVMAKLLTGEMVLNREESQVYQDKFPLGILSAEDGLEPEFQLAGDVIQFPHRMMPKPGAMPGLQERLDEEMRQPLPDYSVIRQIQQQMLEVQSLRLPEYHEGGITIPSSQEGFISNFGEYLTRSYQHLAEGGSEAWKMLGETAGGYLGQAERIRQAAVTGIPLLPEETAGFIAQHIQPIPGGAGILGSGPSLRANQLRAAIKVEDTGEIFKGYLNDVHSDVWSNMPDRYKESDFLDLGFVDEKGEYLTRQEALRSLSEPVKLSQEELTAEDLVKKTVIPQEIFKTTPTASGHLSTYEDWMKQSVGVVPPEIKAGYDSTYGAGAWERAVGERIKYYSEEFTVPESFGGFVVPSAAGGMMVIPQETSLPSYIKQNIRRMVDIGMTKPFMAGRLTSSMGGAPVPDGKGGRLGIFHPGEMIIPAPETSMILGHVPSAQGGMYDRFGTESRGFQSVALQERHGLGKWGWLLGVVGALAGVSLLSSLFSKDKSKDALGTDDWIGKDVGGISDVTGPLTKPGNLGTGNWIGEDLGLTPLASSRSGTGTSTSARGDGLSLGTSFAQLSGNVSKVSSDLQNLSQTVGGTQTQASSLSSEFGLLRSASSLLQSAFSLIGGGGSGSGGGGVGGIFGSLFGGVTKLFGFEGGGILPSGERGMIIPSLQSGGILSITHPNEMVLPANISSFVQQAAQNYAGDAASPGDVHVHLGPIQAWDGLSVQRTIMNEKDTIAAAYHSAVRGGNFSIPR